MWGNKNILVKIFEFVFPNSQIRNSKQFQMVKNQKVPNKRVSDLSLSGFVSDFDIRISDFVFWCLGAINVLEFFGRFAE